MSMEIKGRIIQVMPEVSGMGKKGKWVKQDFVIETEGQYPKKICLSLWGEEKINNYDLEVGLKITASIELESREYNGRWYTEARAWKIEWGKDGRKWTPGGNGGGENPEKKSRTNEGGQGYDSFGRGDGPTDDTSTDDLPF